MCELSKLKMSIALRTEFLSKFITVFTDSQAIGISYRATISEYLPHKLQLSNPETYESHEKTKNEAIFYGNE